MSELQDALDYWDRTEHPPMPAVDPFVEAARRVANGTKEWLCQYPEFNDEACVVDYDPTQTRQPRKHSECGWFITIPAALGVTTENGEGIHDWCNPEKGLHGSQCTVSETIRLEEHQQGVTTDNDDG